MEQLSLFDVPVRGLDALLKVQGAPTQTPAKTQADAFAGLPVHRAVWAPLRVTFPSGEVAKYEANLRAIEVLKALEAEPRAPTEPERGALNLYSGWGALGRHLDSYAADWRERRERLYKMLTKEELAGVEASVNNAFYTPDNVIRAIWKILAGLGFRGGRVLDPSTGVGFFVGGMPTEIAEHSDVTCVEIDPITARIAKALYAPYGVKVHASGFEAAGLRDGAFDLVVTNVPFGQYHVIDRSRVPYRHFNIHNYFFAKSLDMVRPGGLVACVTSAFTMDAVNDKVRAYLATKARLLGAFRLPVSALKPAGCEVTTDIIVLQRLGAGVQPNSDDWTATVERQIEDRRFGLNRWFADHPDRIVGQLGLVGGAWAKVAGVQFDGDLDAAVTAQADKFAALGTLYHARGAQRATSKPESVSPRRVDAQGVEVKALPGSYLVRDDRSLWVREAEGLVEFHATGKTAERLIGMVGIRDIARELVAAQVNVYVTEPALVRLRDKLNTAYDVFVRKFGFLSEQANQRAVAGDPSLPLLLALETRDAATGKMLKADLFRRRTAGGSKPADRCETAADALLVCQDEVGELSIGRIAELLGVSEDQAKQAVLGEGLGFVNPDTLDIEPADLYLSGDVRKKWRVAKAAGEAFTANVEALVKVIPKDLQPGDITATLGSTWIPEADYESWLRMTFERPALKVERSATAGSWAIGGVNRKYLSTEGAMKYQTDRIDATTLAEQAMNQQVPTIRDAIDNLDGTTTYVVNRKETLVARVKQEELKTAFAEWVWKDAGRATRLARIYNDTFNNRAPWAPDGSHLTLPGYTQFVSLRAHQKNGVWRTVAGHRNTLLAHVVGAGKTLTMAASCMELRRLGKASKPMLVVPNNVLEQFAGEFMRAYPSANVLVAGKKDFEGKKRRQLLARMATGDWDAILITHPMFEKIRLSNGYVRRFVEKVIAQIMAELEGSRGRSVTFKELQRQKKVWEARLARLSDDSDKDKVLAFDELGIDWLSVDEAHRFKNLFRFTKMTRVAGLPNTNSQRAFDMLLKTRFVMDTRGEESGVVFATGTPVSNSMAEMWVMQHYLQPSTMEQAGVAQFDAWATNFGEVVTAVELAPDGSSYRMNSRFARFVNLPELTSMFAEVADVRTADMLDLPVPVSALETVVAKASPALKAYVEELVARSEAIHDGNVSAREDNMLKVTGDGRLAALDMRLVDVSLPEDPGGKVALCADGVFEIWKQTRAQLGTQLVFCDLSTPSSAFNVYDVIRTKLHAQGVPLSEIAFIHDYESDKAKARLFADVREGIVRILLGSTEKMGLGTNVQDRLVALHHLDAPWRPADVEQREGRIVRQGNRNGNVSIFRYVTESSFDAYMWQTLETKARFIAQVMSGDRAMRTAEDVALAALSYAEVKALASGNPMVIEKAAVDAEVAKLAVLKTQYEREQWEGRRKLALLPEAIEAEQVRLAKCLDDVERAKRVAPDQALIVDGQSLTVLKDQAKALEGKLRSAALRSLGSARELEVGQYGEFEVSMRVSTLAADAVYLIVRGRELEVGQYGEFEVSMRVSTLAADAVYLIVRGEAQYECVAHRRGSHIMGDLMTTVAGIAERAEAVRQRIANSEALQEVLTRTVGKPFAQQDKLDAMLVRQAEVNEALGVYEGDRSGAGDEGDEKIAA